MMNGVGWSKDSISIPSTKVCVEVIGDSSSDGFKTISRDFKLSELPIQMLMRVCRAPYSVTDSGDPKLSKLSLCRWPVVELCPKDMRSKPSFFSSFSSSVEGRRCIHFVTAALISDMLKKFLSLSRPLEKVL